MQVSKTRIALYLALAVGMIAGLYFEVPKWLLILFGVAIGVADALLDRRRKAQPRPQSEAQRTPRRAPGIREWALLCASIGFCLLALLIARTEWRGAAVVFSFFGGCAVWFGADIRRKLRQRRWAGATVQVIGGVNIYMDAPRMGFIALGLFVVGAVIVLLGVDFPLLMRVLGAFIALVGLGLGVAIAAGFYARRFMRFDPDAVTFGEPGSPVLRKPGYRYRVEWDNIAAVISFEYADNPFVGIRLHDVAIVSVDPPSQVPAFMGLMRSNRADMDVDVFLNPLNFGIDGLVLAAALQRYALDRDARAELVPRRALPGPHEPGN